MTDTPDSTLHTDELSHRRRVAQLGGQVATSLGELVDTAKSFRSIGVPAREWLDVVAANLPAVHAGVLRRVTSYIAMPIDMALEMVSGDDPKTAMAAGMRSAHAVEPTIVEINMARARETARDLLEDLDGTHADEDSDMRNLLECFNAFDAGVMEAAELPATIRMHRVIDRLFRDAARLTKDGTPDPAQAPAIEVHLLLRSSAPIQFSGILSTTPEGGLRLMTPVPGQGGRLPVMMEQFFDYSDVVSVCVAREVTAEPGSRIIQPSS